MWNALQGQQRIRNRGRCRKGNGATQKRKQSRRRKSNLRSLNFSHLICYHRQYFAAAVRTYNASCFVSSSALLPLLSRAVFLSTSSSPVSFCSQTPFPGPTQFRTFRELPPFPLILSEFPFPLSPLAAFELTPFPNSELDLTPTARIFRKGPSFSACPARKTLRILSNNRKTSVYR